VLEWGEYTAVATQQSSIGNPEGRSTAVTFIVEHIPPAVASEAASSVTRTSAALYASVDPLGAAVSDCAFEYGTSPAYDKSIECGFVSGASAFPEAGTGSLQVFARIYGLAPGTAYHFRIVADGPGGRGAGADQTFTTLPPWLFNEEGAARRVPVAGAASTASGGTAAFIARQLIPHGHGAAIATLLRRGAFKQRFKAPGAGTVVIGWYYTRPRAKHARGARARVLVAGGRHVFAAAGAATVDIALTAVGRRVLRFADRVRLRAICVFMQAGTVPVRTSVIFDLRR